jgi:hypothetical protein
VTTVVDGSFTRLDGSEARSALFGEKEKQVDIEALEAELSNLDITAIEVDFKEMDLELQKSQHDPLFRDALQSKNLRKYTRDVGAKLHDVESSIVPTVLALSEEYTTLFADLTTIDTVLAQFESLLDGFRADLGSLSVDIRRLQDLSMSKSVALRNRKALRERIGAQIRTMTLGKHVTKKLLQAPIDDRYLTYLQELNRKLSTLAQMQPDLPPPRPKVIVSMTPGGERPSRNLSASGSGTAANVSITTATAATAGASGAATSATTSTSLPSATSDRAPKVKVKRAVDDAQRVAFEVRDGVVGMLCDVCVSDALVFDIARLRTHMLNALSSVRQMENVSARA